jgi:hypothetical protein
MGRSTGELSQKSRYRLILSSGLEGMMEISRKDSSFSQTGMGDRLVALTVTIFVLSDQACR